MCRDTIVIGKGMVIHVLLNELSCPALFYVKLQELLAQGAFDSEEEAKKWLSETPIALLLAYHPDAGLFAVEDEAVEAEDFGDEDGSLVSPYDGKTSVIELTGEMPLSAALDSVIGKSVEDAKALLGSICTRVRPVDEDVDDALLDSPDGDTHRMKNCIDVQFNGYDFYVKLYYGNHSRKFCEYDIFKESVSGGLDKKREIYPGT